MLGKLGNWKGVVRKPCTLAGKRQRFGYSFLKASVSKPGAVKIDTDEDDHQPISTIIQHSPGGVFSPKPSLKENAIGPLGKSSSAKSAPEVVAIDTVTIPLP